MKVAAGYRGCLTYYNRTLSIWLVYFDVVAVDLFWSVRFRFLCLKSGIFLLKNVDSVQIDLIAQSSSLHSKEQQAA
jgi:hypothetical protein